MDILSCDKPDVLRSALSELLRFELKRQVPWLSHSVEEELISQGADLQSDGIALQGFYALVLRFRCDDNGHHQFVVVVFVELDHDPQKCRYAKADHECHSLPFVFLQIPKSFAGQSGLFSAFAHANSQIRQYYLLRCSICSLL